MVIISIYLLYPISSPEIIFPSSLQSSKLKLVGLFCKFQRKETCELWLRALLRALENFSSGGIGCMYVRQGACNHDCLFESKYFLIAFLSLSIAYKNIVSTGISPQSCAQL